MTVTAQALQKIWRGEERMTNEIGLQTFPQNGHLWRRRDVLRHSFPKSRSSNR